MPPASAIDREEALAKLALRYFTSHGPATAQDFVWWSGLTTADARAAVAMLASHLLHEVIDSQTYWFADPPPAEAENTATAYLLPNYDEYIVGYKDRSAIFNAAHMNKLDPRGNILFSHTIVVNGQVIGTWKRTLKKDAVIITATPLAPLNEAEAYAFAEAAARYGQFLDLPVTLQP